VTKVSLSYKLFFLCCMSRPNQPQLTLEGARALQTMLSVELKGDDKAAEAYVAGLCAYMDCPSRVWHLDWLGYSLQGYFCCHIQFCIAIGTAKSCYASHR
jgi:hypothetical protein